VAFTLLDLVVTGNTGPWELELADGAGELRRPDREPGPGKDPALLSPRRLGLSLWTGPSDGGLVSGPDDPAALDLLGCGPRAELLDYFWAG
jgi:hypothetical protein